MTPKDTTAVAALMEVWRGRVSTTVLGTTSVVAALLTTLFAPRLHLLSAVLGYGICVVLGALALHPRASVAAKGWTIVAVFAYATAVSALGGNDRGAALTYLFTGLVLAALILGTRAALGLLSFAVGVFAVHWWAVATGFQFPTTSDMTEVERAGGVTLSLIPLGLVVVMSVGFLLSRLRESLAHELVTGQRLAVEAAEREVTVRELREANQALEENQARMVRAGKVELLGQLAGTVAHDLNNVLTVVLAEADLAEPQAPEQAAGIRDAVDEAVQLTRQLLVVGRQDLARPEPVDLGQLVEGSRKLLARVTPSTVTLQLEPTEAVVRADPVQIRQVLLNLAANAVQAMPDGGSLSVSVAVDGNDVALRVADTGRGMDEATRAHIFEPFFTTRDAELGSGLGLVSVHFIVEQLGGTIACDSTPGHGTVFTIVLPRCHERPTPSHVPHEPTPTAALAGRVILIAEDEDRVRHTLATALRGAGARVIEAADGRSAIALAELEPHLDLVWTDVVMPHGGGRAVIDWVQSHRPDTPVVISSGFADEPTIRDDLVAGRHAFVPKPFTPSQAVSAATEALPTP